MRHPGLAIVRVRRRCRGQASCVPNCGYSSNMRRVAARVTRRCGAAGCSVRCRRCRGRRNSANLGVLHRETQLHYRMGQRSFVRLSPPRRVPVVLGRPPTIALTGSGPLRLRRHPARAADARRRVVVTSFDRPNRQFGIRQSADDRERFALIRQRVRDADGASDLCAHATADGADHAAAAAIERARGSLSRRAQRQHPPARAAGVPRPIRCMSSSHQRVRNGHRQAGRPAVLHWATTDLEAYYQEAGRAGRDGRPFPIVSFCGTRGTSHWKHQSRPETLCQPGQTIAPMILEYFGEP